jgi:hypothetical protein
MRNIFIFALGVVFLVNCSPNKENNKTMEQGSIASVNKYEPADGQCFVFIGQDLGAIGGVEGYDQGYCNHYETPAGVTVYLALGSGNSPVSGLYDIANWGSGDCCANAYPTTDRFSNSMIAIGLTIAGQEQNTVNGQCNHSLDQIGQWIKGMAPRPVFLRIGYEFDGYDWNHYVPETYIPAFRYIRDYFDRSGIENIAYVWQSKGFGISLQEHDKWYPGNEYVDWCAYSHFGNPDGVMIQFARSKGKPVFIAESTPIFQEGNTFFDADIKKPEIARKMWDEWFTGFFRVIEENPDVVKAFSYINVDWYTQPMWIVNSTFQQSDSRIQMSEYVSEHWKTKIAEKNYLNAGQLDWNH